jgi:hypothetical protein
MGAAHLVTVGELGRALAIAVYEVPNRAVGISIQEIERTQIRLHYAQPIEPLVSGTGSGALMWQNDPLGPVSQADSSHHPTSESESAVMVELMVMDVDSWRWITAKYALAQPAPVSLRCPSMVVAST